MKQIFPARNESHNFLQFASLVSSPQKLVLFTFFLFSFLCYANAQDAAKNSDQEAAYTRTINQRADKIVTTLGITNASKATRVRDIVAGQYRNLNNIHTDRDTKIKAAKAQPGADKSSVDAAVKNIEADANSRIEKLHKDYLSKLSKELTSAQIDQVKDGMTYDVVHVTYNGYVQMIPSLKEDQKKQIMTWLVEAREHAMDAESSDKKHWWFGKYKGRINNYLSSAGYDIQKERAEWEKRIKAEKSSAVK